ncbi:DUF1699 family protein [Candidatus Methanocrinis natronophilus]|uniref:DUF1699 family protein n=1 Tax=Candidatus Methanocrinis natronophilus TaxID=3033396 RepID=A0ABT5X9N4_9EURY|nr:DUF1699 family protein [Candidatus Methanocrinis natronophilus]MDF0591397.1 DUF1699 family protein [Candidatus Methanocrinis natronophilus]
MKFRVVSSKEEISNLGPNERNVHLAFRPSNVDFLDLMKSCPRLRVVQVPPSYHKTLSKAIKLFLDMQGITLLEGDVWGHRKDIDEYYVVDEEAIEEIGAMMKEGESIQDAAVAIQRKTRLAPDLIKYIARSKITA